VSEQFLNGTSAAILAMWCHTVEIATRISVSLCAVGLEAIEIWAESITGIIK